MVLMSYYLYLLCFVMIKNYFFWLLYEIASLAENFDTILMKTGEFNESNPYYCNLNLNYKSLDKFSVII